MDINIKHTTGTPVGKSKKKSQKVVNLGQSWEIKAALQGKFILPVLISVTCTTDKKQIS